MTFKHYFFNRGLWMHAWRQSGWIGIIYLLAMIFAMPVQLAYKNSSFEYQNTDVHIVDYLFKEDDNVSSLFTLVAAIIMAVILMRYIQSKRAVEMFHSLPVRREQLLTIQLVSGFIMLLVPIWITALITELMAGRLEYIVYTGDQVIDWAVSLTVISLFFFTFTIFVGMCIGQSILQGVVTVILLLLPTGLTFLYTRYFIEYLYGYFREDRFHSQHITSWSPIERVLDMSQEGFSQQEGWIYLLISLAWIALSYWLYKWRPTEKATQSIVFRYLNPLFRIGVTLCSALLLGMYGLDFPGNWNIMLCIIGGLLGYLIAEMVLRKTWHIFDRRLWVSTVIYGVITSLLIYIPLSPLTRYEARVPLPNEVKAVYAGNNPIEDLLIMNKYGESTENLNNDMLSSDPNYIQLITNLHSKVATNQPDPGNPHDSEYYMQNERVELAYVLKDGGKMFRSYMIPINSEYKPYVEELTESLPYRTAFYHLTGLQKSDAPIVINNPDNSRRTITITIPSEIKQLQQLIIKERLAVKNPTNEIIIGNKLYMETSIYGDLFYGNNYRYEWNPTFKPTERWLKQKGYWDKVATKAEDISSIIIVPDQRTSQERLKTDYGYLFEKYKKSPQKVIIRDRTQINELLNRSKQETYHKEHSYALKLKFKDGIGAYRMLTKDSITPEIYNILPK